jgi:hypothetical protein
MDIQEIERAVPRGGFHPFSGDIPDPITLYLAKISATSDALLVSQFFFNLHHCLLNRPLRFLILFSSLQ